MASNLTAMASNQRAMGTNKTHLGKHVAGLNLAFIGFRWGTARDVFAFGGCVFFWREARSRREHKYPVVVLRLNIWEGKGLGKKYKATHTNSQVALACRVLHCMVAK